MSNKNSPPRSRGPGLPPLTITIEDPINPGNSTGPLASSASSATLNGYPTSVDNLTLMANTPIPSKPNSRNPSQAGQCKSCEKKTHSRNASKQSTRTTHSFRTVSTSVLRQPLPWIRRRICPEYSIYMLYTLSFLSAGLDAASFTAWTAFLNMQTGNTIFLALGASGQPSNNPYAWITALGSIIMFILGSQLFGMLSKYLGPRTRRSLAVGSIIQALCTLIAAVLIQVQYVPIPNGKVQPSDYAPNQPAPRELAAIMPLAFAAAGQVVSSRELGFPLIPTLVLTTIYADAFRDTKLLRKGKQKSENPMRSKMLITIVVFMCGAIAGGWTSRSSVGTGGVVWLAVGLRFVMACIWVCWPWEEVQGQEGWWDELEESSNERRPESKNGGRGRSRTEKHDERWLEHQKEIAEQNAAAQPGSVAQPGKVKIKGDNVDLEAQRPS